MQISYGNGGWVRVDAPDIPGPIYLRYRDDAGLPVLTGFFVDANDSVIDSALLAGGERGLDIAALSKFAMHGMGNWLQRSVKTAGPDLSRLASHFATTFGRSAKHWVADSMRAQYGADIPQAPMASARREARVPVAPEPVSAPTDGLTDDFLRTVAANVRWATANHLRPAPFIARQTNSSDRTVHAWIRKARQRGVMPATTQGRAA